MLGVRGGWYVRLPAPEAEGPWEAQGTLHTPTSGHGVSFTCCLQLKGETGVRQRRCPGGLETGLEGAARTFCPFPGQHHWKLSQACSWPRLAWRPKQFSGLQKPENPELLMLECTKEPSFLCHFSGFSFPLKHPPPPNG